MKSKAFTLIELLVVIAIIGVLAGIILIAVAPARGRARDARRKQDLSTIGQFVSGSGCYAPDSGAGDYDIQDVAVEVAAKNPQYANYISYLPKDPKTGTADKSFYHYLYDASGHCAIYANLENENEVVTLNNTTPQAGATGIWAGADGWNGSNKYYQLGK